MLTKHTGPTKRRWQRTAAALAALALTAAACGSDDDADEVPATAVGDETADEAGDETADEAAPDEEPTEEEPADGEPADEEPVEEEPADEADPADEEIAEPGTDEIVAAFDANGDGTVTIGVAAAGPRDDNGYYQSLVNFAESYSEENGFAPPIVSDNIGPAEAAQAMSDLAQQGVDIMMVGASEIAEPLPDLTEEFSDIFWYCNCGAGFEELPGLAQATDWGAAVHYSAGVAMGAVLQEQGSTSAVFLGCCDINFEVEAYEATVYGIQSVDPSFTMEYVGTGDFEFDFDNSANATAALTNAQAEGATLAYAYLGGALDPVGQLAADEGLAVFAAGPADACERDIPWTGSVVFDGGVYASQALTLIIEGELTEGATYQFPTEAGLNGALLCDPSPEASAAVDEAFGLLASFDDALYADLGAISGAAYGG